MPLNYSIAMLPNPMEKSAPPRAYAKAQINGEMSLKELSKEVSNKCTVHSADVSAVLIATVETLLAALKEGKQVDFGELGKFRLQITSKGAMTAEEFTANNITGVNIHDTTAGFKCYRRRVLETINLDEIRFKGYAFQIEMKYTTYKCGFKIKEVPVIFINRELGTSKMSGGIFSEAMFGVMRLRWDGWFKKYPKPTDN